MTLTDGLPSTSPWIPPWLFDFFFFFLICPLFLLSSPGCFPRNSDATSFFFSFFFPPPQPLACNLTDVRVASAAVHACTASMQNCGGKKGGGGSRRRVSAVPSTASSFLPGSNQPPAYLLEISPVNFFFGGGGLIIIFFFCICESPRLMILIGRCFGMGVKGKGEGG